MAHAPQFRLADHMHSTEGTDTYIGRSQGIAHAVVVVAQVITTNRAKSLLARLRPLRPQARHRHHRQAHRRPC